MQPCFVGSRLAFYAMNRSITLHKIKPFIYWYSFSFWESKGCLLLCERRAIR